MGSVQSLVLLESGMVYQFAVMPSRGALVWICSFQPIWSDAQGRTKFDPPTTLVSQGGYGLGKFKY